MQDLKVSLIQSHIYWEHPKKNLEHFSSLIQHVPYDTSLCILPEMFNTGFTMKASDCSEPHIGPSFKWLQKMARQYNMALAASVLTLDQVFFYNRLYFIENTGVYQYYDKHHLFRMGHEHKVMTAGKSRLIKEYRGWKFNLQICYDLRFPVFSMNKYQSGQYDYDALIYVANWPEVRKHAYLPLLKARAIENQAYVIWVNRVGKDGNDIYFSGNTMVIDPYGKILAEAEEGKEEILSISLSAEVLNSFRDKFRVGLDWDDFTLLD